MTGIAFLNPVPPSVVTEYRLAPRLDGLDGAVGAGAAGVARRRIGLLDNRKANAGPLLDAVAVELSARHPGLEIETEHKLASAGAPADVLDRLRTCHAVILAIAD